MQTVFFYIYLSVLYRTYGIYPEIREKIIECKQILVKFTYRKHIISKVILKKDKIL